MSPWTAVVRVAVVGPAGAAAWASGASRDPGRDRNPGLYVDPHPLSSTLSPAPLPCAGAEGDWSDSDLDFVPEPEPEPDLDLDLDPGK